MPERVHVAVRIRPFLPNDPDDADLTTIVVDPSHVSVEGRRVFTVDRVFQMEHETREIYEESVRSIVVDFMRGYNATVMAYGQTGSGKTYTMSGLMPAVVEHILDEDQGGGLADLSFQFIEVYGEQLRDLLSADPVESTRHLHLHDAPVEGALPGTCFVTGAHRVRAASFAEVQEVLRHGAAMRATGMTGVHADSSRSHSILTIFHDRVGSKLHLVDLAGSERNKKTNNVGLRLQESIGINGGLLALGNVIRALSRGPRGTAAPEPPPPRHIPYRSSKLTRLLQDALGGTSKTLLIACVAPDHHNAHETLCTLQYCALAMRVVNDPVRPTPRAVPAGPTRRPAEDTTEEDLRTALAEAMSRLQVCEEELQKDERIFVRQIEEMRRVAEENATLRRRLRFLEGRPETAAEPAGPAKAPLVTSSDEAARPPRLFTDSLALQRTSLPRPPIREVPVVTSLAEAIAPNPPRLPAPRSPGSLETPRWTAAEGGAARDEQLLTLAKEALHYQTVNAELRREVSSVTTRLETERRESALLRLELHQMHGLLRRPRDSAPPGHP